MLDYCLQAEEKLKQGWWSEADDNWCTVSNYRHYLISWFIYIYDLLIASCSHVVGEFPCFCLNESSVHRAEKQQQTLRCLQPSLEFSVRSGQLLSVGWCPDRLVNMSPVYIWTVTISKTRSWTEFPWLGLICPGVGAENNDDWARFIVVH